MTSAQANTECYTIGVRGTKLSGVRELSSRRAGRPSTSNNGLLLVMLRPIVQVRRNLFRHNMAPDSYLPTPWVRFNAGFTRFSSMDSILRVIEVFTRQHTSRKTTEEKTNLCLSFFSSFFFPCAGLDAPASYELTSPETLITLQLLHVDLRSKLLTRLTDGNTSANSSESCKGLKIDRKRPDNSFFKYEN